MEVVKLRAHHLLCVEGFEGYGYNRDFVCNMSGIVSKLNANSNVVIVNFCDEICSKCPSLNNGVCVNEKGGEDVVRLMDERVIKMLSIERKTYLYFDLKNKVNDVFRTKKDLEGICSLCSWKKICKFYISRL